MSSRGAQLGDEHRDAERDRRRDGERKNRRVERAPDERQRTELARNRIPDLGAPEIEAEFLDRQHRLPRQLEADRTDNQDQDECEGTRPDPESQVARTLAHLIDLTRRGLTGALDYPTLTF